MALGDCGQTPRPRDVETEEGAGGRGCTKREWGVYTYYGNKLLGHEDDDDFFTSRKLTLTYRPRPLLTRPSDDDHDHIRLRAHAPSPLPPLQPHPFRHTPSRPIITDYAVDVL